MKAKIEAARHPREVGRQPSTAHQEKHGVVCQRQAHVDPRRAVRRKDGRGWRVQRPDEQSGETEEQRRLLWTKARPVSELYRAAGLVPRLVTYLSQFSCAPVSRCFAETRLELLCGATYTSLSSLRPAPPPPTCISLLVFLPRVSESLDISTPGPRGRARKTANSDGRWWRWWYQNSSIDSAGVLAFSVCNCS